MEADEWRLSGFQLRLGRSSMHGEFARTGIGVKPLITAKLEVGLLDVVELESHPPAAGEQARAGGARPGRDRSTCPSFRPAST